MANPRKPSSLKVIAGTDQPCRALPKDAPVLPTISDVPKPPDWLPNAHAVKEWQRLAPILVAADALRFPGAMAVGDELSVYVEELKQGRTSLRLKAEAVGRHRDGETETVVAEGEFTFVALDEAGKPREVSSD